MLKLIGVAKNNDNNGFIKVLDVDKGKIEF
jgi:hypothetical protein